MMKHSKILWILASAFLCSCGVSNDVTSASSETLPPKSSSSLSEQPISSSSKPAEEHPFNLKVPEEQYLATEATCTEPATYYYSNDLGQKGTDTFSYGEPLGHDVTEIAEVPSTCLTVGVAKHYECERCHKLFSDAAATTEVTEDELKLPLAEHSYGGWSLATDSEYPNFKIERECAVCHETETKDIHGYDLTQYDFGVTSVVLDSNYAATDSVIAPRVDDVEQGLVFPFGEPKADNSVYTNQWFDITLPKMSYANFGMVEYRFKIYNIYNRTGGDAGYCTMECKESGAQLSWGGVSAGNHIYATMTLRLTTANDGVHLAFYDADGALKRGGTDSAALSTDIANGKKALSVQFHANDGYRNLVLLNPIVREKYVISNTELRGAEITYTKDGEAKTLNPVYCTNNYVDGQEKLRFDLTNSGLEDGTIFSVRFPRLKLNDYDAVYFPIYLETGNQNADHLRFSFDGENFFGSDTAEASSTAYLQFVRNGSNYLVSYINNAGQKVGTTTLSDAEVIAGTTGFAFYGKVNVNWRKFSFGIPAEGVIPLTYDFSLSTFDAKVVVGSKVISPYQDTNSYAPKGTPKLRFDLTDSGAESMDDPFQIYFPKMEYSSFVDLYVPFVFEAGCQSAGNSNLQFGFAADGDLFNTDTADNQVNYFHFKKNGTSYTVEYLMQGTSVGSTTLNDAKVISGEESFVVYGSAGANWRRFSICNPVTSLA